MQARSKMSAQFGAEEGKEQHGEELAQDAAEHHEETELAGIADQRNEKRKEHCHQHIDQDEIGSEAGHTATKPPRDNGSRRGRGANHADEGGFEHDAHQWVGSLAPEQHQCDEREPLDKEEVDVPFRPAQTFQRHFAECEKKHGENQRGLQNLNASQQETAAFGRKRKAVEREIAQGAGQHGKGEG